MISFQRFLVENFNLESCIDKCAHTHHSVSTSTRVKKSAYEGKPHLSIHHFPARAGFFFVPSLTLTNVFQVVGSFKSGECTL